MKRFTVRMALVAFMPLWAGSALAAQPDAATQLPARESAEHKAQQARAWSEIGKLPNLWEGTWQGITDIYEDFSATPSYTPEALKYITAYKPPEDSTFANCTPPGMPFVMYIVAMPMKFFPAPGMIGLYLEDFGQTRFIHMDGRQHSVPLNPTFLGESIGHWEGDTLVVDTTGLGDETMFQLGSKPRAGAPSPAANGAASPSRAGPRQAPVFGRHGPNVRYVERMRMKDFNTLEIRTTVYDDTVFAQPYSFPPREYHRYVGKRSEPQEWVCSDNRDYLDLESGKLEYDVKEKARNR
jgi:hypothetical protein